MFHPVPATLYRIAAVAGFGSAAILLVSSDAFEFSWRYQLPAVTMLPLAGALGLTALAARSTAARTTTGGTRRPPPSSRASATRCSAGPPTCPWRWPCRGSTAW